MSRRRHPRHRQRRPDGPDLGPRHRPDTSRTLTGHTGGVCGVAFTPDGTRLATASDDGTVRIWDAATGQHLATLTGHTGPVQGGGVQPPTAPAWPPPATTGRCGSGTPPPASTCRTLTGHTGAVQGGGVQPADGTRLATASDDGTVRIWDAATGQHLAHPHRPHRLGAGRWRSAPTAPAWPPPATTGRCGSGTPPPASTSRTLTGHTGWVRAVAFSPRRHPLATASDDGTVRIWDPATGQHLAHPHRPHRLGDGRWRSPPTAPPGHRQRRPDGAALGPRHRRARPHPHRPHRPGSARWRSPPTAPSSPPATTRRCGCGTPPPARSWPPSVATNPFLAVAVHAVVSTWAAPPASTHTTS